MYFTQVYLIFFFWVESQCTYISGVIGCGANFLDILENSIIRMIQTHPDSEPASHMPLLTFQL